MRHDPLNDAIISLKNSEREGKSECVIYPSSKLIVEVLKVFQDENYIGEFEVSEENRGGTVRVKLNQAINDCGVIKPRYAVKNSGFTDWEKRYLPSRDFGILVVSTPKGVMTHKKAVSDGLGGRLVAYIY
ncbi:MAG TPA: 30S ribosomal protein S8 [Candidatus Altiarchaeales archaeon]|nr:30S ribosomal protein S8 [Candidatus Altiarchaeales archaeon]